MEYEALIRNAVLTGATRAEIIDISAVVLSSDFRDICATNKCGNYGKCWMCPPEIGEIEKLMGQVKAFEKGLLYQTVAKIEDSYDIEGMFSAAKEHAAVSYKIQESLKPMLSGNTLHLSCGGCHLCNVCAKLDNRPCRHPDKALSSLEGYGIDVYKTVANTTLKYVNGENTVTFFGLILFSEQCK